jgi:hypothetical protein
VPNSISDYITGSDIDEESKVSGSGYIKLSIRILRKLYEKLYNYLDLQLQKLYNIPNLQ